MKRVEQHTENRYKPWTISDIAYACRHHKRGNGPEIAAALGRTRVAVMLQINRCRQQGTYEYYKNLNV